MRLTHARRVLEDAHAVIFRKHRKRAGERDSVDDILIQLERANGLGLSIQQHADLLGITPEQLGAYKAYQEQITGINGISVAGGCSRLIEIP
jgi:hypothetical protein